MHHGAEDHQKRAAAKETCEEAEEAAEDGATDAITRREVANAGAQDQADKDGNSLKEIIPPTDVNADRRIAGGSDGGQSQAVSGRGDDRRQRSVCHTFRLSDQRPRLSDGPLQLSRLRSCRHTVEPHYVGRWRAGHSFIFSVLSCVGSFYRNDVSERRLCCRGSA